QRFAGDAEESDRAKIRDRAGCVDQTRTGRRGSVAFASTVCGELVFAAVAGRAGGFGGGGRTGEGAGAVVAGPIRGCFPGVAGAGATGVAVGNRFSRAAFDGVERRDIGGAFFPGDSGIAIRFARGDAAFAGAVAVGGDFLAERG